MWPQSLQPLLSPLLPRLFPDFLPSSIWNKSTWTASAVRGYWKQTLCLSPARKLSDNWWTNADSLLSYRAQTWRAASGMYRHAWGPLFHGQESKIFCKLQLFCVKDTHQALTNTNVSYSFLFWIQQRLIWPLFFSALCHLMSLAVGRWLR